MKLSDKSKNIFTMVTGYAPYRVHQKLVLDKASQWNELSDAIKEALSLIDQMKDYGKPIYGEDDEIIGYEANNE